MAELAAGFAGIIRLLSPAKRSERGRGGGEGVQHASRLSVKLDLVDESHP
jgi:hypothetical protein